MVTEALNASFFLQVFTFGRRSPCCQPPAASRRCQSGPGSPERQRLVHLRLQPGAGNGREHSVAALRAIWCSSGTHQEVVGSNPGAGLFSLRCLTSYISSMSLQAKNGCLDVQPGVRVDL